MGNAHSYGRNGEGYYVMQRVCLQGSPDEPCAAVEVTKGDKTNEFYKIRNPAPAARSLTATMLHTADNRYLFFARNALGTGQAAREALNAALLRPLYFFSQHPNKDIEDESTKRAVADTQPPAGFCIAVEPCDELMQGHCCKEEALSLGPGSQVQRTTILYAPAAQPQVHQHDARGPLVVACLIAALYLLMVAILGS